MERVQRIFCAVQGKQYPNASKLARELEVSAKTVQRDLAFMRERLQLPLEWDAQRNGYWFTQELASLPSLQITEGEVLALFVAQRALNQYRATPFEGPLRSAFLRLAEQMKDLVTFSPVDLDQYVSFAHSGAMVADLEVFRRVMQALLEERELTFTYQKLQSRRAERRVVQPWHMACIENRWYLFGQDLGRGALRCFHLGRIREVVETGAVFRRPKDFSPARELAQAFGVFRGTGNFRIRLRFDEFGARLVREGRWHESQEIEEEDGGLVLTLRLGALEEIERWVLSFGAHVRVLEPAALRDRVKAAAREMAADYSEGPAWALEVREGMEGEPTVQQFFSLFHALERDRDHPGQLQLELGRN